MPFYRFEEFGEEKLTPHLSSARGPIIEGDYIYFCLVSKDPGTGSKLHYHPNELMIFPVAGKIHSLVGKDRRIVAPGTFIHIPPYARHQMLATEDGQIDYLYVKDRSWTVVGIAQDEAVPDAAPTVEAVNKEFDAGNYPGQEKEPEKSEAIVEGLRNSYHPIIDSLDAPPFSTLNYKWVEGERLTFGFFDLPEAYEEPSGENAHEQFIYIIKGVVDARVDGERETVTAGGVIHIPKGSKRSVSTAKGKFARYATVRASKNLEDLLAKS
ncbi:MAG: cupin domain-containing protein [Nitrospinota bacterium]|jgi:quercetin dioxygenase-like cupin family protein|nr:cupin domain-containing protein [Nitrospinota bacterium]MDP7370321.1 cupin domain-containing protein [Nitrospinota bacterium]MDP7664977.1 cupin domain-containing protein [Nitrospinota bacterium]